MESPRTDRIGKENWPPGTQRRLAALAGFSLNFEGFVKAALEETLQTKKVIDRDISFEVIEADDLKND